MAAGLATLDQLEREGGWDHINALGDELEAALAPVLQRHSASLARVGSIFWMSLSEGEAPRSAESIPTESASRYTKLFHELLSRGVALAPSAYEVGFLSTAHKSEHITELAEKVDEVLALE